MDGPQAIAPASTRFRVSPPDAAQLIAWPEAMGTRAVVFVDTEEEFDWSKPFSRDNRTTSATVALPEAARRFAGHGCPLAFMVDHPIASDPHAVERLRGILAEGQAAIGAQLHPWVNPPFDEPVTPGNSFPGNMPPALEAAKLDVLMDTVEAAFGVRPRAYRAGRYGIGPNSWRLLAERGYRLDSSVRAHYDYRRDGGPDFGAVGNRAYWADRATGLIELPLTTVHLGMLRGLGERLYRPAGQVPGGRGVLARAGLMSRISLTPEGMPIDEALEAVRAEVGKGRARLLAFSFHSPSLVPGHTPYVRDKADLAAFWTWWDRMFALLDRLGVRPIGIDALIDAADAAAGGPPGRHR